MLSGEPLEGSVFNPRTADGEILFSLQKNRVSEPYFLINFVEASLTDLIRSLFDLFVLFSCAYKAHEKNINPAKKTG
jgi:hypothetical protein